MTELLAGGEIQLWLADLSELGEAGLAACHRYLSAEERQRNRRLADPAAQRADLAARALVRLALGRALDLDPGELRFAAGPHGKPFLDRLGGASPAFNLSHCRHLVVCALARQGRLGVDVECTGRRLAVERLVRRYCADVERAALAELPPERRAGRFLELWTLKEAFLKARGEGISLGPRKAAFRLDGDAIAARFDPALGERPEAWWFGLFAPVPAHRLALALGDGARPVRVRAYALEWRGELIPVLRPLGRCAAGQVHRPGPG